METNFKSQICTTREQSERLLALGLKSETADMFWRMHHSFEGEEIWRCYAYYPVRWGVNNMLPAWSLHRLIEMMPNVIGTQGCLFIAHQGLYYSRGYGVVGDGLYECIVQMYEWLIKDGHFNKEYYESR